MYEVIDTNKPAIIWGNDDWNIHRFHSLEAAYFYMKNWLGHFDYVLPKELTDIVIGHRYEYSGYGDWVSIEEVKD